ncbi:MAG: EcsC family protein [Arcanobacterium sp.]|nr:EcsC family protein [Arcanobacterium sp.]
MIKDFISNKVQGQAFNKATGAAEKLDAIKVITAALRLPYVRIDREAFLRKSLRRRYPRSVVNEAISTTPAAAGVSSTAVKHIAKQVINAEARKATAISFATGLPGGAAMLATVPADLAQYFAFLLRVIQKLAYLYGFEEFDLQRKPIPQDTVNQILVLLGVMFKVEGSSNVMRAVAEVAAQKAQKNLARRAAVRTLTNPMARKVLEKLSVKLATNTASDGLAKVIPVVGGFTSAALTHSQFKKAAHTLRTAFEKIEVQ